MNGLDMLNTAPSGVGAGQAVAARAGDAGPDDPGGDASRSFNALLARFDEPAAAAAEGPAQPAAPAFATPPSAVLRQVLQIYVGDRCGQCIRRSRGLFFAGCRQRRIGKEDIRGVRRFGADRSMSPIFESAGAVTAGGWSAAIANRSIVVRSRQRSRRSGGAGARTE